MVLSLHLLYALVHRRFTQDATLLEQACHLVQVRLVRCLLVLTGLLSLLPSGGIDKRDVLCLLACLPLPHHTERPPAPSPGSAVAFLVCCSLGIFVGRNHILDHH